MLLADNNFGDTRGAGLAGPTGLVIILLLALGTFLLVRNMNARLRRLPERFVYPPAPKEKAVAPPDSPISWKASASGSWAVIFSIGTTPVSTAAVAM